MNLSELIDVHRGGRSYAELSKHCGGSPTSKRLQQLATQPIKNFPDPPTVVALAKGLRVPQSAVVLAAAESLGLDVSSSVPRVVELMPAGARRLTEQQAGAVAHLVRTIVDATPDEEAGEADEAAPIALTVEDVLAAQRDLAARSGVDPDDAGAVASWIVTVRNSLVHGVDVPGVDNLVLLDAHTHRTLDGPADMQTMQRLAARREDADA